MRSSKLGQSFRSLSPLRVTLTAEHHRFARFLVVGALNSAVGYGLFLIALAIMPSTFIALCASTMTAVLFNFFTTGGLVFGSRDPRRVLRFYGVYAIVFAYNAIGLAALEHAGLDPRWGAIVLLPGRCRGRLWAQPPLRVRVSHVRFAHEPCHMSLAT